MAPRELPIACSLSASDLSRRVEEIAALGRDGLLDAEASDTSAVLRFRPGVRARLEAVVAAEAECCPFLTLDVRELSGALELRISAPAGAQPVVRDLVAAFRARSR